MEKTIPPYLNPEYEETDSFRDEDEGDLKVFEQLREIGADLTDARHCLHYFYFPSEAAADHIVPDLVAMNFMAQKAEPLMSEREERRWLVVAQRVAVISPEVMRALRLPLKRLAKAHGGKYDGWAAKAGRADSVN